MAERNRRHRWRRFWCGILILPAFLLLQPLFGAALPAAAGSTVPATPAATTADPDKPYHPPLQIEHSATCAVVLETGRLRRLYDKNADQKLNIPAAAKLMTALIACERLPLDTLVTISKVAAAAESSQDSPDGVSLDTGDKYPLEYLLYRLFFYDSDAAALAIAEQIANVEAKFVDLMNSRAASFDLTDTVFKNCTGDPVYEPATDPTDIGDLNDAPDLASSLQHTTPAELAKMMTYAIMDENFSRILRKDSEFLVLEGKFLVTMRNRLQSVWRLSEDMITGAFYSEDAGRSYLVAIGKVRESNIVAILADGKTSQPIPDLLDVFQSCADHYVLSPLVEAGVKFTGEQEQTVDGELFGLVYKKTVYYIHPADDPFVRSTVRYNSFGPHSRPIQRSMTVGQVILELMDGTTIAVDVAPDRQILSSISILDIGLNELQNNRNLFVLLMTAAGMLLLILLLQIIAGIGKVLRLVRLVILEKRSRR